MVSQGERKKKTKFAYSDLEASSALCTDGQSPSCDKFRLKATGQRSRINSQVDGNCFIFWLQTERFFGTEVNGKHS